METVNIKFKGIDSWNRPIFKAINKNWYFGSTETLFGYDEEEQAKKFFKENINQLTYFGTHFDCEPLGIPINELKQQIKLNIVED